MRELPRFSRELVNLGGVTDSYQPAEKELGLMPGCLHMRRGWRTGGDNHQSLLKCGIVVSEGVRKRSG